MKVFALFVFTVAADPCPWGGKCTNAAGDCSACAKSPFAGDDRCVCGPASEDWVTKDQCKSCKLGVADSVVVVASDSCPWGGQCTNSAGVCSACNKSPFAGDDRCVCGPASEDWVTKAQCKSCKLGLAKPSAVVVADPCPWGGKCTNTAGVCSACSKSPFAGDDRCVCGTVSEDWVTKAQCKSCKLGAADSVVVVASDSCPWGGQCTNSAGVCSACNKSPFAGDDRCVCGPASEDWVTKAQCKSCKLGLTEPSAVVVADPCPWGGKCTNAAGVCTACAKSPFAGDDRCVCGPASEDWVTKAQCKSCKLGSAEYLSV